MRKHVVTLTERQLRMILAWYDVMREDPKRGFAYDSPARNMALYDRLRKL